MGIPVGLELVGLFISMKAPGNKARGGEAFGLSFSRGIKAVGAAFYEGIIQCINYLREKPLVFVGLVIIFLVLINAFLKKEEEVKVRFVGIICMLLWCLYSAMFAPAIYADVEVSGGVDNMNYQTFLLVVMCILILAANKTAELIRKNKSFDVMMTTNRKLSDGFYMTVLVPGLLVCLVIMLFFRGNIKESTTYVCFEYIISGQAADYKEQMDLQTELLTDEKKEDVIVPLINDVQGPLMHMPVTSDSEAWTNSVTAAFYGKKSVVGISREAWMKKYEKS